MTLNDAVLAFADELRSHLGEIDFVPVADGQIHRFYVQGDKRGTRNGWYVLHTGTITAGAFGSWRSGGYRAWHNHTPRNSYEAQFIHEQLAKAKQERELARQQCWQETAYRAAYWLQVAKPADPSHPYLQRKGIGTYQLKQRHNELIVPMYINQQLVNIQRITAQGDKFFLKGGQVSGAGYGLGFSQNTTHTPHVIYIAEGLATAATIYEESGLPTVCAFNAGNLLPVGQALRKRYPHAELIIAGDDDRLTEQKEGFNPGKNAANNAALALGCDVMFPQWPEHAPHTLTDFNDLAVWLKGGWA